jgi:hypothetical protein
VSRFAQRFDQPHPSSASIVSRILACLDQSDEQRGETSCLPVIRDTMINPQLLADEVDAALRRWIEELGADVNKQSALVAHVKADLADDLAIVSPADEPGRTDGPGRLRSLG